MFTFYFVQTLLSLSYFHYAASTDIRTDSLSTLCDDAVPSYVKTDRNIWKIAKDPEEDDLDRFMVLKTGCTYEALQFTSCFWPPAETFDGTPFKWRGAVRARNDTLIQIRWGNDSSQVIYNFFVGEDDNNITQMYEWGTDNVWKLHTPGILAEDRYFPFYIILDGESLKFGKSCESEPLFRHNVTVRQGDKLQMLLHPWSYYGVKFLLDCPYHVTSNARSSFSQRGELAHLFIFLFILLYTSNSID